MIGAARLAEHYVAIESDAPFQPLQQDSPYICTVARTERRVRPYKRRGRQRFTAQTADAGRAVDEYLSKAVSSKVDTVPSARYYDQLVGEGMLAVLSEHNLALVRTQARCIHVAADYVAVCDLICRSKTVCNDEAVTIVECKLGYHDPVSLRKAKIQAALQACAYASHYKLDTIPEAFVLRCVGVKQTNHTRSNPEVRLHTIEPELLALVHTAVSHRSGLPGISNKPEHE